MASASDRVTKLLQLMVSLLDQAQQSHHTEIATRRTNGLHSTKTYFMKQNPSDAD